MEETRKKRLTAAASAMSVIVLFMLILVLSYQIVSMVVKTKTRDRLKAEIARYEQEIKDAEENVDLWKQEWKIEERARQLNYVYKQDDDKNER